MSSPCPPPPRNSPPLLESLKTFPASQAFTPVTLEVTDPAGDPMAGAVVTFYETLDASTPPCSAEATCPPAPLIEQQSVQTISASDGTVILNPIASPGQAVRLYVTAVTGSSALLNFELEQYPYASLQSGYLERDGKSVVMQRKAQCPLGREYER